MTMREEERNETRRVGIGPRLRVMIKEGVNSAVMTRWEVEGGGAGHWKGSGTKWKNEEW